MVLQNFFLVLTFTFTLIILVLTINLLEKSKHVSSYILCMITIKCHSGSRSGDKSEAYNTFKDSPAVHSLTAHSENGRAIRSNEAPVLSPWSKAITRLVDGARELDLLGINIAKGITNPRDEFCLVN